MPGGNGDDNRIVRYTFREQIVIGKIWRQTNEAEIDLVALDGQILLGTRHVEEV